ncbi:MAG TPA: glycoside hydrolase family 15 protein [Bacilli bacterium]|nr:glycoside hydrolase family 15 protein [Bacilli bacterium]
MTQEQTPEPSDLARYSRELLLAGQANNGAFPASIAFSHYDYCWLRDGTFVAYALDVVGEHEAAKKFYRWVHRAILRHQGKVARLLEKREQQRVILQEEFLHTRFTVEGAEGREPWGNFQLDGYGAYLWGVGEHVKRSGDRVLAEELGESLDVTVGYLVAFWAYPCFDCWEEHGDRVHPGTLAAVYGGLQAISSFVKREVGERIEGVCQAIREKVEREGTVNGRYAKSLGDPQVDANLLWLAVPFGLVEADDVRMRRTVEAIETELCAGGGGVHRYPGDTFYGGGAWLLLTSWLGWYYAQVGRRDRSLELLQWVERQADEQGHLPEQVPEGLLHPERYGEWVARWGEPAKPLYWSHAMYLIHRQALAGK